MKIDAFSHIMPRAYYDRFFELDVNEQTEDLRARVSTLRTLIDLDERFRQMDEFGEYKQLIAMAAPPVWDLGSPEVSREMARIANARKLGGTQFMIAALMGPLLRNRNSCVAKSTHKSTVVCSSFAEASISGAASTRRAALDAITVWKWIRFMIRVSTNCATGSGATTRMTGSSANTAVPSGIASTAPAKRNASR